MKKTLFTLLILFSIVLTSKAENKYFYTTVFSSYVDGIDSWSEWEPCNLEIIINNDTKHIEIFSKEIQVIDYTGFTKKYEKGYYYLFSNATDRKYDSINVYLYVYDDGKTFMLIEYGDCKYMYDLHAK